MFYLLNRNENAPQLMNNAPNALTESADSLTRLEPVMDPRSLIRVHRNISVYRLKVGKGENQLSFSNIGWERFSFHSSAFYSRFSLTGNPNDSLTLWGNEINRGWLQKKIPGLKSTKSRLFIQFLRGSGTKESVFFHAPLSLVLMFGWSRSIPTWPS